MTPLFKVLAQKLFRPRVVVTWICATLIAAYAGPFGSFDQYPAGERVLFWALQIGIGIILAYAIRVIIWNKLPDISHVATETVATVAFSLSFTPITWAITTNWIGGAYMMPFSIFGMFGFVFLVAASVSIFVSLLSTYATESGPGIGASDSVQRPPLMNRLPQELRGDLIYLCAADHYVQVYTDRGDTRLLMRFADALNELGDADGLQVHRSYWVARDAVFQMRQCDGRLILLLANGKEVPVSRSYREIAEAEFSSRRAPASESPD